MITKGIDEAVEHILEDLYLEIQPNDNPANTTLVDRKQDILSLIKSEAINLADRIIGKDRVIRSETDLKGGKEVMNVADKAVFDFQVEQRIELAKYQNPSQVGATGPEDLINDNLAPNEA